MGVCSDSGSKYSLSITIKHNLSTAILLFMIFGLYGCGLTTPVHKQTSTLEALDTNELKMTMLADISSIVVSDNKLASDVKVEISQQAIAPLINSSEFQISGKDSTTRPIAVTFQKAFEQSLMNMIEEGRVTKATAIIHTRKPTTPLCNPVHKAVPQTMTRDLQKDPRRIKTIEDRTVTLRKMASFGPPLDLYVAYLQGGLKERSPEEQAVYLQEIHDKNNTSLHDEPLTCSDMPDNIVGASYILTTKRGNILYFSNNGTQAIEATDITHWRYWFGSLLQAPVEQRFKEVLKYLKACGLVIHL